MKELLARTDSSRKGRGIRIGLCGSPGAGKSSIIEQLGVYIAKDLDLKVAVLAIDPSS